MKAITEPLVESEDTDYTTMSTFDPSDVFTPSLPALIHRRVDADDDAHSVSDVQSISNGETISDSADDYDEITYSDLQPSVAPQDQQDDCSEEDMQCIMMSNQTITPSVPMTATVIKGLYLAEEPYQPPHDRPLRLMFIERLATTTDNNRALIISKVVTSITGDVVDKAKIIEAASKSPNGDAAWNLLESLSIPVEVQHVVDFGNVSNLLRMKDGQQLSLDDTCPDFAILYHQESSQHQRLSHFADVLSRRKVPLLELARNTDDHQCVVANTLQGPHFLRSSRTFGVGNEDQSILSEHDTPLSQNAFLYTLKDDALSRHLAFITNHAMTYCVAEHDDANLVEDGTKDHADMFKPCKPNRLYYRVADFARSAYCMTFCLILLYGAYGILFNVPLSPLSDLNTRAPVLQTALAKGGITAVNATDVLRYPTTTSIVGTSAMTALSFPTAANVHIIKPDQLLISLPPAYYDAVHIDVLKNGKTLSNVNTTRLIKGVYSLSLPSPDAHGQIQVHFLSTTDTWRNETIKVDLGNRLLQRVTYGKVEKSVQQGYSEAHNVAKFCQNKVLSDVQTVLNQSISGFRFFGNSIVDGFKSTSRVVGALPNQTTQGVWYMGGIAYNTTSAVSSFAKSAVPQRRHLVRASNNLLKIRTLLMGSSPPPKKSVQVGKSKTLFQEIRKRAAKIPDFFLSRADATQKVVPLKPSIKAVPVKDKPIVKVNVVKSKKDTVVDGKNTKQVDVSENEGQKSSSKDVKALS